MWVWVASRTGVFTYFYLQTDKTKKRIRKTKEEILEKVKESIMIEEVFNEDIKKQQKVLKAERKH